MMGAGALAFDVKIYGLPALQSKLKLLPTVIQDKVRGAQVSTARIIVSCAKKNAPKDIGNLAANIRAEWSSRNRNLRIVKADVGGKDLREIAAPVEYGREALGRKDAQPFLRPCLAQSKNFYFQSTVNAVDSAIGQVFKGGSGRSSLGSNVDTLALIGAGVISVAGAVGGILAARALQ